MTIRDQDIPRFSERLRMIEEAWLHKEDRLPVPALYAQGFTRGLVAGVAWANGQADREPSALRAHVRDLTGETDEGLTEVGGFRGERHDSTETGSVAPTSDAEVEAAARAAYDRAFLKHAPEDVDRWDDLAVDNDEAAESWREVARVALLAAQEVRRATTDV